MEGLRKLTVEMSTDPDHPVRKRIQDALIDLARDLQEDADTRARVEGWKEDLLANRSVASWLDTLWQKGRAAIIASARNPDAVLAGKLGEVMRSMGGTLESDSRIRAAVNQFARRAVAGMAASYGGSIVKLVSDTVRGWDARTITARLEAAVGRDLRQWSFRPGGNGFQDDQSHAELVAQGSDLRRRRRVRDQHARAGIGQGVLPFGHRGRQAIS